MDFELQSMPDDIWFITFRQTWAYLDATGWALQPQAAEAVVEAGMHKLGTSAAGLSRDLDGVCRMISMPIMDAFPQFGRRSG